MDLLWTLGLSGLLAWSAVRVARCAFRLPAGLDRWLGAAVLAWAWLTVGMEVLGALGLLTRVAILGWFGIGLGVSMLFRHVPESQHPARPAGEWDAAAIVALGFVLTAAAVLGGSALVGPVKVVSDGPIYHLYFAARWWKAGRLFLVATPFGESAATYFPAGGDLWFTWLFVAWGGERLAKVGQAPFLLLAALSAYAMARRLHASRSAAVVATCMFVASTPLLLFSFEPNVDTIFVAGYLTAAYFFLRFALHENPEGSLILGGLAAGCAWGTKPTGHLFIPVLLALLVCAILARGQTGRNRLRQIAALSVASLLPSAYWFLRNALLTGNPLYPLQVAAFGRIWFVGWYGSDVMRLSPYYLPRTDWRSLIATLMAVFDPREVPFWLAAVAGAWRLGGRASLDRWVWVAAALAVANVALYWLLIPYRTQQRFMLQAVGMAVVPLARLLDRGILGRGLAASIVVVHLVTRQSWPWPASRVPWTLGSRIPSAIPAVLALTGSGFLALSILLALGVLTAWSWKRWAARSTGLGFALALVLSAALLGSGALAGLPALGTRRAAAFFPSSFPDYYRGWIELDARSGPAGATVAYAGTNLPYYLLGSGLRNQVRYVNVDAHRDWLLHDYHREAIRRGEPNWPTSRPGWDRIRPDYRAWLANLRARGIQLLVVCRANPMEGPFNLADAQGFPIERQWAELHPESFRPLYGVSEPDKEFRIYRLIPSAEENRQTATDSRSGPH